MQQTHVMKDTIMYRMSLFDNIISNLTRLASDKAGGVAVIFAISIFPLLLFLGVAIDYSGGAALKTRLQIATDAAVLAAAKSAHAENVTQAKNDLRNYIKASIPNAEIVGEPVFSEEGSSVCVNAKATYDTILMRMVGYEKLYVTSYSCTKYRLQTFEIAIVLDVSDSMASSSNSGQTKLAAAKTAAKALVADMSEPGAAGSVAFSLVPFDNSVNIGSKYANADFMDTEGKSSIHWQHFKRPVGAKFQPKSKFDLFSGIKVTWDGCVEERPEPYLATDTPASSLQPDTLFVPYLYPDGNDNNSLNNYLNDNGGSCQPNDLYALADNETTNKDGQTKICKYDGGTRTTTSRGPNYMCLTKPIVTLTRDANTITTAINALATGYTTNLFSGMMWGWRTISPNGPFNSQTESATGAQNAKPYGYIAPNQAINRKVIVFLTDGMNVWNTSFTDANKSYYSPFGFMWNNRMGAGTSAASLNTYTKKACQNAKEAGVIIYTVGLRASASDINATGLSVLSDCASGPQFLFVAETGDQLIQAFKDIAHSMTEVRLSN